MPWVSRNNSEGVDISAAEVEVEEGEPGAVRGFSEVRQPALNEVSGEVFPREFVNGLFEDLLLGLDDFLELELVVVVVVVELSECSFGHEVAILLAVAANNHNLDE